LRIISQFLSAMKTGRGQENVFKKIF